MNRDIKVQNLHLHCRTCLCLFTGIKHEVDEIMPRSLFKLFKKSTGFKKSQNVLCPSSICEQCFNCLKSFDEFQIKAKESNQYLEELLRSYKPTHEEVEVTNQANSTSDESERIFSKTEVFQNDLSDNERGDDPLQCVEAKSKEALLKDESNFESVLVKVEIKEADEAVNNKLHEADSMLFSVASKDKQTDTPNKKKKKFYVCENCQQSFKTASARKIHMRSEHNDKPIFECDQCNRKFNRKSRLKNHKNENHAENPVEISCKYGCGKKFRRSQTATNHYRIKHALTKQSKSFQEQTDSPDLENLLTSSEINKRKATLPKVEDTDDEQSERETEEDEMVKLPNITKTTCDICHKIFSNTTALKKHKNTHQETRPFQCDHCERGFNCKSRLEKHIREIHSENPILIECKFRCGKSFRTSDSAGNHYRRYHTEKAEKPTEVPYICEDCGRIFKCMTRLRQHSYQHRPVEERPFHCKLCDKRYVFKKTYKEHMLRHTGVKNFECSQCGLKKTTKQELRNHMKYHTDELKVACPICSKIFGNPPNLRRHIQLVHEGVKNFKCRFCEECFGKAETLKHHEMRHTGEKPHKCEICERSFIQQVALKTHMKTHNKLPRLPKGSRQNDCSIYENNALMNISESTL